MFNKLHPSHTPHHLRFVTFLLRIALGVHIFYLGFANIVDARLLGTLRAGAQTRTLFYWLNAPGNTASAALFLKWAFFVIGTCLVIGLFTRLASLLAILLFGLFYFADLNLANASIPQLLPHLVNEQLIIILCFLIIIFSKAGNYLGLDKFFHFALWRKK